MTTMAASARPQELTRRAISLIFVTILLGILVSALDQTVVSTALPTIVGDLGAVRPGRLDDHADRLARAAGHRRGRPHGHRHRGRPVINYLGVAFVTVGAGGLVLATSLAATPTHGARR